MFSKIRQKKIIESIILKIMRINILSGRVECGLYCVNIHKSYDCIYTIIVFNLIPLKVLKKIDLRYSLNVEMFYKSLAKITLGIYTPITYDSVIESTYGQNTNTKAYKVSFTPEGEITLAEYN